MNNENGGKRFMWLVIAAIIVVLIQHFFSPVIDSLAVSATHIWTPTKVATVHPHPTATPIVKVNPLLYQDSLNSSSTQQAGWQRGDTDGTKCFFASDGYHIRMITPRSLAICHQHSQKVFQDFNLTVDIFLKNNVSGLLFRDQAVFGRMGAYLFEVNAKGQYKISPFRFVNEPFVNWTSSSAIHRGNNIRNTLRVTASGYMLRFYINNIYLVGFNDKLYMSGGVSFSCSSGEAVFSNLHISSLV